MVVSLSVPVTTHIILSLMNSILWIAKTVISSTQVVLFIQGSTEAPFTPGLGAPYSQTTPSGQPDHSGPLADLKSLQGNKFCLL